MQLGDYRLKNAVLLAPMAGITDLPFRRICCAYGAGLTFSEMMSANPKVRHTEKSRLRLAYHEDIGINAVQIVGADPDEMAQAARLNVDAGASVIDINMGCPVKKVNRKMSGSALLQYPELVKRILTAVVNAVNVPVTLKIRTGWDRNNRNCVSIAQLAEQCGIVAVTVHGRTRSCLFEGQAEYASIKAVKNSVSIPVIANGDIISAQKARDVLDYTGADAVMIGRGALGNPWIFRSVSSMLETGKTADEPDFDEKCSVILSHIRHIHQFYGEEKGYRIARKHVAWYLQKIKPDSDIRQTFNALTTADSQFSALEDFFNFIRLDNKHVRTTT